MMRMLDPGGAVVVAGGMMMRMLGPGGGRAQSWSGGSGGVRGVGRLLPCCLFWLVGGWGRVRLFSATLALAGLEVVGLVGLGDGRRGAWPAGQGPVAGAPAVFAWWAFARFRVRSENLRTVFGGSVGHGSAARLSSKGWWGW